MIVDIDNPWQTIDTEVVYSNNWVEINHNNVITPAGTKGIYGVAHFKNIAVAIVPLDLQLNTYLVGQYRFPLNEYSWELPMGGAPIGNNILEGAQRELLEETGLLAEKWTEIAKIHTSNCVTDEVGYVFIAENLTQIAPMPEETEQLTIRKIPFTSVIEMAEKGEITDAISLIAIFKTARILGI